METSSLYITGTSISSSYTIFLIQGVQVGGVSFTVSGVYTAEQKLSHISRIHRLYQDNNFLTKVSSIVCVLRDNEDVSLGTEMVVEC